CTKRITPSDRVLWIFAESPDESKNRCARGWKLYQHACFKVFKNPKTWKEANLFCQTEGGDLASIDIKLAYHSFHAEQNVSVWIGLNDLRQELHFEWSDHSFVTHTRWNVEEPSNLPFRQEDCVVLSGQLHGFTEGFRGRTDHIFFRF
uniref:C-type lectin domain-containing protein n=1 Tax=Eptatretus burgeri TaxID=7764 RepID=A0A8C4QHQ0_EPTBU